VAASSGAPTGTVDFFDGGNSIGACTGRPLVPASSASAKATCTISYSAPGTHSITATYGSSGDFRRSDSAPLAVTVHPAPTSSQIKSSLYKQIPPHGKAAKIKAILKAGGYTYAFKALIAGKAKIEWFYKPKGKKKPLLVATGGKSFSAAGTSKLKVKLTKAGKSLLKKVKKSIKLSGKGSFKPSGGSTVATTRGFTLRR
jgi:hypothetical protein